MMTDLLNLLGALHDMNKNLSDASGAVVMGKITLYMEMTVVLTLMAALFIPLCNLFKNWHMTKFRGIKAYAFFVIYGVAVGGASIIWIEMRDYSGTEVASVVALQKSQEAPTQKVCAAILQGFRDHRFHVLDITSQELVEDSCGKEVFLKAANDI